MWPINRFWGKSLALDVYIQKFYNSRTSLRLGQCRCLWLLKEARLLLVENLMSKPQDRVTRSVLNYWSPQGAYPLLRFFAYTRKYILKDQPHSRRVSAPPGECQWDEKIASTNSRKSSCRYAQILDLATLLACFEAGEPIFSFGVFFYFIELKTYYET